ncbi:choice-of-anchor D domain-containing protein [Solirubrobacter sp. CPCC 204708]|uniref:Choice-of-anchor D domain-containing protein n=1 Tax=Solirubrobacter deserti TaxID=2282478 RepID=A0ABT4RKM6_9ACTN|nr:kelch repeat-containing protein [Solirubrobacter deserti]MBE2317381.1 choice-of-anchor D domain-containing protein [Solirubrobacter deserti]MDA0139110.1 choice-of-anchor D domain-containing protein [Solirubrobacter deserti]
MLIRLTLAFLLALAAPAHAGITLGWAPAAPMSVTRTHFQGVALDDGRLMVAGGSGGTVKASVEFYDPLTDRWSPGPPMSEPRTSHAMTKLTDGRVLVAGGFLSATAEIYDPRTNAWTPVRNLAGQRRTGTLVPLAGGRALLAGGSLPGNAGSVELFDPLFNGWTSIPTGLPADRRFIGAAALPNNGVLVGPELTLDQDGQELPLQRNWTFSHPANTWSGPRPMHVARIYPSLTALADGRVLAAGGSGDLRSEIYDPATGTWTLAAATPGPIVQPISTLLANGQVMLTNGNGSGNDVFFYSPATNTWSGGRAFTRGVAYHSLTRLHDGRVLLAGGNLGSETLLWTPTATLSTDRAVTFEERAEGTTGVADIVVTNTSAEPLVTADHALSGGEAGDFAVDAARCRSVAPGASCRMDVRFTPRGGGVRGATLSFAANTTTGTYSVALSGRGIAGPPAPPAPIPAGQRDDDGDGLPNEADACAGSAGPRARRGCPTGLLADPSIRYQRLKNGIKVVAYYVKATTGARITVTCTRNACRRATATGKGARPVRIKALNGKRLRNGTRINVTVALPGRLTTPSRTASPRTAAARAARAARP